MRTLVFLLEERSAKECLKNITDRLLSESGKEFCVRFISFDGKSDLDRNLEAKIKNWVMPETDFVVVRDQDAGDCVKIKNALKEKCRKANRPDTLIRIACHELEAFYLGDIDAVRKAFPSCKISAGKKKFRDPDKLGSPSDELKNLTDDEYEKIKGSREIAPYLKLDGSNRSKSFNNLISGIRKLISKDAGD